MTIAEERTRLPLRRDAPGSPRRPRQGRRQGPLRGRPGAARHAVRARPAVAARPRPDRGHRHVGGGGDARRASRHYRRRLPRPAGRRPRTEHDPQPHGARQGAVRGARRGRRGRLDPPAGPRRRRGDRGHLRGVAARAGPPRRHGARRPAAARGHLHDRPGRRAHRTLQRLEPDVLRGRRHREGIRRGRRRRGGRVRHQADPSGLHRAARLRGRHGSGRQDGHLVLVAGALPGALPDRRHARLGHVAHQGDPRRDRRRLRRQDDHLPGAAGGRAVVPGGAARSRW